ncbi:MAG: hypothetical protein LH628_22190 [Microcoleus sp. CAN_BIN18]|nr:hypothetical protein [Microcoleus sp. CAN_BIN18]
MHARIFSLFQLYPEHLGWGCSCFPSSSRAIICDVFALLPLVRQTAKCNKRDSQTIANQAKSQIVATQIQCDPPDRSDDGNKCFPGDRTPIQVPTPHKIRW